MSYIPELEIVSATFGLLCVTMVYYTRSCYKSVCLLQSHGDYISVYSTNIEDNAVRSFVLRHKFCVLHSSLIGIYPLPNKVVSLFESY